jgi:hypothetical protein
MSQAVSDPKDLITQGAARAKNMGVALFMIGFLLGKYFLLKIVWVRVEKLLAVLVVRSAVLLGSLYKWLKPHLDRYRVLAVQTKNKLVRVTLGLLIVMLTPLERGLLRFFGVAKTQSEKLAVHGTTSAVSLVVTMFKAMSATVRAGISKPAIQRLLMRLFQLLDEAEKT